MGRGILTAAEIQELRSNPYVVSANEKRIIYSTEFKKKFMEEYNSGKGPSAIFRDAGFDLKVLGTKRVERAAARWRESYESGTLGDYDGMFNGTASMKMDKS